MLLGDGVDQLHDEHGLADTGTTEETDLTTSGVGGQQIDDLNTYLKYIINIEIAREEYSVSKSEETHLALKSAALFNHYLSYHLLHSASSPRTRNQENEKPSITGRNIGTYQ